LIQCECKGLTGLTIILELGKKDPIIPQDDGTADYMGGRGGEEGRRRRRRRRRRWWWSMIGIGREKEEVVVLIGARWNRVR